MTDKKVTITVQMEVKPAQALGLKAMFSHWNRLSQWGCSRWVAFRVDGDGDFHPKCQVSFSEPLPEMTEEIERAATAFDDDETVFFDYDGIYQVLREKQK